MKRYDVILTAYQRASRIPGVSADDQSYILNDIRKIDGNIIRLGDYNIKSPCGWGWTIKDGKPVPLTPKMKIPLTA